MGDGWLADGLAALGPLPKPDSIAQSQIVHPPPDMSHNVRLYASSCSLRQKVTEKASVIHSPGTRWLFYIQFYRISNATVSGPSFRTLAISLSSMQNILRPSA
jgi:hypothetical protein